MSQPRIRDIKSFSDVNHEKDWIHRLIGKLENSVSSLSSATIITSTVGEGNYRSGLQSLIAGNNSVVFSSALPSANYHLIIEIYATDGTMMPQSTIDSNIPKTSSGFTVTTSEASIIKYTAILYV
jgi:hypothetical protein